MTLSDVTGAVGSVVPEEERKRFFASLPGSLLGQAVLLLATSVAYVAALAVLHRYVREELQGLREWLGAAAFWAILLAPLAVIVLFQVVPAAAQARRDARLRRQSIAAADRTPGVFRLFPYGSRDAESYVRPDGADHKALDWLQATSTGALLYLFGASGSGKSSLLGAGVLPRLEAEGWTGLTAAGPRRPGGQPARGAPRAQGISSPRNPRRAPPLRTLLDRAAEERTRADLPPLLVVIDQFEEFLILGDADARAPLLELLPPSTPSPGRDCALLCVFRSDYRELLFRLGLPRYLPDENAFELAPFLRAEAETFLRKGGRMLTPEGYAALFAGLDCIEDTRAASIARSPSTWSASCSSAWATASPATPPA